MKLTAIIEQGENDWLVGQIEEIPAVLSQGKTVEELKPTCWMPSTCF
jgi:predicted RNase H-like HicB family nuclease